MSLNRWSQTTVGKKMYFTSLFVFTMVAISSCSTRGGNAPDLQNDPDGTISFHGSGPLQLTEDDLNGDMLPDDGFIVLNRRFTPRWVTPLPVDAGFKFALMFKFNHEIDPATLEAGHTFKLTLNGEVAEGEWFFNPQNGSGALIPANIKAVFYTNRRVSEIIPVPLGAGESLFVSIRMKGARGSVTDSNGNILPFNGVYKKPEEPGSGFVVPDLKNEDLLDGDRDGVPGGDFVRDFEIIG